MSHSEPGTVIMMVISQVIMQLPSLQQAQKGAVRPKRVFIRLFVAERTNPDYNPEGIDVFDEDWDNLLILDACRYDTFAERSELDGELEHRISRGAATPEWLRGNFRGKDLRDTVYVTANPMYEKHKDDLNATFHAVWQLWKDDWGWDEDLQTVPPEVTAEYARKAAKKFPDKRLLIHFNQPHGPLLGPTAEQSVIGPGAKPTHERTLLEDLRHRLEIARVSTSEWRQAYNETFDLVHDAVEELLPSLRGKTVISADHGEMMGERAWPLPFRHCSHQEGYYRDPLIKVPWFIIDSEARPEIRADRPVSSDNVPKSIEVVNDRLQDLGYIA